jgi:hypothetical protein
MCTGESQEMQSEAGEGVERGFNGSKVHWIEGMTP